MSRSSSVRRLPSPASSLVLIAVLTAPFLDATTLTLTSAPTTANSGATVTLTATVSTGATGKVTFYDGVTVLGVSAISGTTATLKTASLPSGTRTLRAHYWGDSGNAAVNSASVSQTITPKASPGFGAGVNYPGTGDTIFSIATADFNGDLKPDLAFAGSSGNVNILISNGDGTFRAPVSYPTGNTVTSLVAGDWNGDGNTDLAVANISSHSVTILLGNGDGTFHTGGTFFVNVDPYILGMGDWNGDGKPDLVVGGDPLGGTPIIAVVLGNGDGTFQTPVNYTAPGTPTRSVAIGDFNRDGVADLAFGYSSGVVVYLGNADGTFRSSVTYPLTGVASVITGDFNNDGKPDVLASSGAASLQLLTGNGDGTFQSTTIANAIPALSVLTVVDWNGDGNLDALFVNNSTSTLGVLNGNGDGTFRTDALYPLAFAPNTIVANDWNGDGKLDVALAGAGTGAVTVMLAGSTPDLALGVTHGPGLTQGQTGAYYKVTVTSVGDTPFRGTVTVSDTLPSGFAATTISGVGWTCTLANLTCTRADVLVPGSSYPPIYVTVNVSAQTGSATNTVTLTSTGDGNSGNNTATDSTTVRSAPSISLTSSPNPSSFGQNATLSATVPNATGKVTFYDGANLLGLATLSSGQASFSTSLLSSGTHALTARFDGDSTYGPVTSAVRTHTVNALSTSGLTPKTPFSAAAISYPILVADFNRDGKQDLLTTNPAGVNILLGNGDGTFQVAKTFGPGLPAHYKAIGDFNGDGNLDLVIANSSTPATLYLMLGNGDGTFQNLVQIGSVAGPLTVADFNGDGFADLGVAAGSSALVFLGAGNGTFQAPITTPTSSSLGFADMNNDGKPDLVSIDGVMLGNGDGTFQTSIKFTGATPALNAVFGDFNGDGKLDILSITSTTASLWRGNGDGTFQTALTSTLTSTPADTIVPGDFSGDSKLDIAYRDAISGALVIVVGNGDGTFQAGASYAPEVNFSTYPGGLALGDFNGDGRPDIAVAHAFLNTISIFLGTQSQGLSINVTHTGRMVSGGTGAYTITITNPGFAATSGAVAVSDTLPTGFTAKTMTGPGWGCSLSSVTCTRSDALASGASYPPITLSIGVDGTLSPGTVTNQASSSYSGVINTSNDPTVIVLATATSLSAAPSPATPGQNVILSATIAGSGTPTGVVGFFDNSTPLGFVALTNGQANLATRLLTPGPHSLLATYPGDATHASSRSFLQNLNVNAALGGSFSSGASLATGPAPSALISGDFNNDGALDVVAASSTGNTISVFLGASTGAFQSKVDYAVGAQPVAIAAGDFNGDGKQDLIVATQSAKGLSLLLGKGDGTFQAATTITLDQFPISVAAGDLDQDSKLDLLVTLTDGTVKLLLGNGDGTFVAQTAAVWATSATWAGFADFDGDGMPDAIINFNQGSLALRLGNGDGTFRSQSTAAGQSATRFTVGDLNGDGRPDVVVAGGAGGVSVYLGNGDGTLKPPVFYPASSGISTNVTLVDLNGDGKLDVVSGGTMWLGNGDGTLGAAQAIPNAGATSDAAVAGDFNGDGRTDLALVSGNTLSTLFGATTALKVTSTHSADFLINQTGNYTITVTNNGPNALSDTVTVVDTLPSSLTATALSGAGWSCTLSSLTCTRTTALAAGSSYPVITLSVNVGASGSSVTNVVSASSPGAVSSTSNDQTAILAVPKPVLTAPTNGATGLSLTPTLTWGAVAGATSYDVYFGTDFLPPLVTNTTTASYTIPSSLSAGTTYYWRIVAKNTLGSTSSDQWNFVTAANHPSYAGYLESATCTAVSGWAADRNRLNQSITVNVYDGATLLATVPANALRSDVGAYLGDNGLHAFNYTFPVALGSGTHTLRVVFEASTTELTGSSKAVTCATTTNYAGYVDASSCSGISGWAADRNRPNTAITVSLWDGVTQIASTTANGSRPDVGTAIGDNGLHGFSLQIPAAYANGVSHTLQLHYESSATLLGSPITLTCGSSGTTNYVGYVDTASCTGFSGWVADRNRLNTPITVSLWDGSTPIASTTANSVRADVGTYLNDNGLHGFSLAIPANYANGVSHTLQLHYESSATLLGTPVTLTCGGTTNTPNYSGWVDASSCSGISGWAVDRNKLNQSITVSLWDPATQTQIASTTANTSRPDVGTAVGDNGLHGFTLLLPQSYANGVAHTLQLHYESSATLLGAPITLTCGSAGTPNYAGYVDNMSCSAISGWAADRNALNTSINVSIYDGATLLQTIAAATSRPDVGTYLGDNGLHAFSYTPPASVKDGKAHTITVRPGNSTTALPGAQSLTCQ